MRLYNKYCEKCGSPVVYGVRSCRYSPSTGKPTQYQHEWYCRTSLGGLDEKKRAGHYVKITKTSNLFTQKERSNWGLIMPPGVTQGVTLVGNDK